ncbi:hypothetical protein NEDG_00848 [Nematocida displodere]|uniref:Uncharacterized protein n=1 Tax=Nematocida displodere TaxID=1805483 RepID=A0A177ECP2_9MICR|nr:hypothetical protein NEDG_00848 [Nematocida displodere]
MNTSTSTTLEDTRTFVREQGSFLGLGKNDPLGTIQEYYSELERCLEELEHLEDKMQASSTLLKESEESLSLITSSNDPIILREVLSLRIEELLERKCNILDRINLARKKLQKRKDSLETFFSIQDLDTLSPTAPLPTQKDHHHHLQNDPAAQLAIQLTARNDTPPKTLTSLAARLTQEKLIAVQRALNQMVLEHYQDYNQTMKEIENISSQSALSQEDRRLVRRLLCPKLAEDLDPKLTKMLRRIFGVRVLSARSFLSEVARKSGSREVYLTSTPDLMDKVVCYTHFLRKYLLASSFFLFGSLATVVLVMYQVLAWCQSYRISGPGVWIGCGAMYAAFLGWVAFGLSRFLFPWVFGYTLGLRRTEDTPDGSTHKNRSFLTMYPVYAANVASIVFLIAFSVYAGSSLISLLSPPAALMAGHLLVLAVSLHAIGAHVIGAGSMLNHPQPPLHAAALSTDLGFSLLLALGNGFLLLHTCLGG